MWNVKGKVMIAVGIATMLMGLDSHSKNIARQEEQKKENALEVGANETRTQFPEAAASRATEVLEVVLSRKSVDSFFWGDLGQAIRPVCTVQTSDLASSEEADGEFILICKPGDNIGEE